MKTLMNLLKTVAIITMIASTEAFCQPNIESVDEKPATVYPSMNKATHITTSDGFVFVAGYESDLIGNNHVAIRKYNDKGMLIAKASICDGEQLASYFNKPSIVVIDKKTGGIYVGSSEYINAEWGYEVVLKKFDAQLNELWNSVMFTSKKFDDEVSAVVVDNNFNVSISGVMKDENSATNKIFIKKFDADGNKIFESNLDYDHDNLIVNEAGMIVDNGGNIFICGTADNKAKAHRIFITKINNKGILEWKTFADATNERLNDEAKSLCFDNKGNILVGGSTEVSASGKASYVVKFDINGKIIFHNQFNNHTNGREGILKIKCDAKGTIIATSYFDPYKEARQSFIVYIIKNDGTQLWSKQFAGKVEDMINPIEGCFYVIGSLDSKRAFGYRICMQTGKMLNTYKEFPSVQDHLKDASVSFAAIAVDSKGKVFVCGQEEGFINGNIYDSVWLLKKVDL